MTTNNHREPIHIGEHVWYYRTPQRLQFSAEVEGGVALFTVSQGRDGKLRVKAERIPPARGGDADDK